MKLKKVVVKALRRSAALRHNLRQRSKDLAVFGGYGRNPPVTSGLGERLPATRSGGDITRRKYAAA